MVTSQQWNSLKGRGTTWTGLDLRSPMVPMAGQFRILRNLFVSSDGTELRRIPGWRPAGTLQLGEPLTLTGAPSAANPTVITFASAHKMYTGGNLRVSGNTSTAAGFNGDHVVTVLSTLTLSIPVDATDPGTLVGDGTWLLSRGGSVHRVRQYKDRFGIVGEGVYGTNSGVKVSSLVAWVHDGKPDVDSPVTSFNAWRSAPLDHWDAVANIITETGVRALRRKCRVEVADGKLLIAAPGYGCCWEADFRNQDIAAPTQQLHCLGVPKGLMSVTSAEQTTPPTGTVAPGTYYAAVAYMKNGSDELGLQSEPVEIVVVGATSSIDIIFAPPWHVMNEMPDDCSVIILFGTQPDALFLLDIVTIPKTIGLYTYNVQTTPASYGTFQALNVEQMPTGALDIAYMRGFGCFGGHLEHEYDVDTTAITASIPNDTVNIVSGPEMLGGRHMSPAYQGIRYWNPPGSPTWVTLDSMEAVNGAGQHRWTMDALRLGVTTPTTSGKIIMPTGLVQISAQGQPNVVPHTNKVPVDLLRGDDIESIGRVGSSFIIASTGETYVLGFGRSPMGSEPYLISDKHGAITPIIEVDGGCAWMSDRGPVMSNGSSVTWIGEPVEAIFRQAMRDSTGKMPHAVLGYDATLRLVYFGIRTDRTTTDYATAANDDEKSRIANDSFLIYSLDTGGWSLWDVPYHLRAVHDMAPMVCEDGIERLCFLAGDVHDVVVYAFDPDYSDTLPTSGLIQGTLASGGEGTQFSFLAVGTIGTGTATAVGMGFMVTSANGTELRGYGVVKAIISANEIAFGDLPADLTSPFPASPTIPVLPLVLSPGDKIYIGVIHSALETLLFSWDKDFKGEGKIMGVGTRHSFGSASTPVNFVSTRIEGGESADTVTLPTKLMRTKRSYAAGGGQSAQEQKLVMNFIGTAPVALKDIRFERGPGA